MQLRQIFSKDIERNINPAVVVSEQDKTTVQTEIEEYVFTPDLIDNLYKFLYEIFNQKMGKPLYGLMVIMDLENLILLNMFIIV